MIDEEEIIEKQMIGKSIITLDLINSSNEQINSFESKLSNTNMEMLEIIEKENNEMEEIKTKINSYHFFMESNEKYLNDLQKILVK